MRIASACLLATIGLSASACLVMRTPPTSPGQPEIDFQSETWVLGSPMQLFVWWPNATMCDDEDWGCIDSSSWTTTVLAVNCDGCTVVGDPTGKTSRDGLPLLASPTRDSAVTVSAMLRFDATGDTRNVSMSPMQIERETGVQGRCALAPTDMLDQQLAHDSVTTPIFRDCGTSKRSPEDSVVVFPSITTNQDDPRFPRFPFCGPTQTGTCIAYSGEQYRPLSTLTITPAPTQWAYDSSETPGGQFAVLPADTGDTIAISTVLADGTPASATVSTLPAN